MIAYDGEFPGYGFAQHKGYGVPQHAAALKVLGPTPLHRLTFPRLRRVLGLDQLELDFSLGDADADLVLLEERA
jgi:ribonuclease HII